jgi:hypothetical protein
MDARLQVLVITRVAKLVRLSWAGIFAHLQLNRIRRRTAARAPLAAVLQFVAHVRQGLLTRGAGYLHGAECRTGMTNEPSAVQHLAESASCYHDGSPFWPSATTPWMALKYLSADRLTAPCRPARHVETISVDGLQPMADYGRFVRRHPRRRDAEDGRRPACSLRQSRPLWTRLLPGGRTPVGWSSSSPLCSRAAYLTR